MDRLEAQYFSSRCRPGKPSQNAGTIIAKIFAGDDAEGAEERSQEGLGRVLCGCYGEESSIGGSGLAFASKLFALLKFIWPAKLALRRIARSRPDGCWKIRVYSLHL